MNRTKLYFPQGQITDLLFFKRRNKGENLFPVLYYTLTHFIGQIGCQLLPTYNLNQQTVSLGIDTHNVPSCFCLSYSNAQHRRRRDLTFNKGRWGECKCVDGITLTSFGAFFTEPQAKRSTWKRFAFVGLDQQADTEWGDSARIARARQQNAKHCVAVCVIFNVEYNIVNQNQQIIIKTKKSEMSWRRRFHYMIDTQDYYDVVIMSLPLGLRGTRPRISTETVGGCKMSSLNDWRRSKW